MNKKKVCILGAGISGLTLAHFLKKYNPSIEIVILEKDTRTGGVIGRQKTKGFVFDTGPKTFRVSKSEALLDLVYHFGLQDEIKLSSSNASLRYLYHKKRLHLLPTTPFKALTSPLTRKALFHLIKEFKVKPIVAEDESIGAFVRRRFGNYIADVFFDPFTLGIYAADMHNLSVRTCFPFLKNWEKTHGSVLKALLKNKSEKNLSKYHYPQNSLLSLEEGLYSLVEKLSESLKPELKLGHEAIRVERENNKYKIFTNKKNYDVDAVFSALPLQTLKKLDAPFTHAQRFLLEDFKSVNIVSIHMEFEKNVLPLKGFGYLIPSNEKEDILGVLFDSQIFKTHDQKTRLTVMMGGSFQPQCIHEDKNRLIDVASAAIKRHLKIEDYPSEVFVNKYPSAIPQFPLYHAQKMKKIEKELNHDLPMFYLAGNYVKNGSLNGCIQTSEDIAKNFVSQCISSS